MGHSCQLVVQFKSLLAQYNDRVNAVVRQVVRNLSKQ